MKNFIAYLLAVLALCSAAGACAPVQEGKVPSEFIPLLVLASLGIIWLMFVKAKRGYEIANDEPAEVPSPTPSRYTPYGVLQRPR